MKNRQYKIPCNPYNCTLCLVLTDDVHKTAKRIAKKIGTEIEQEEGVGASGYFLPPSDISVHDYYMVLNFKPDLQDVVHEADHARFEILRDHDVIYSLESEEAFTYTLDHIFGEIMKRINK